MSTKAAGNTAINDKIRTKLPLVVKTEHADVEQLIWDELYPNGITNTENTTLVLTRSNLFFDYEIILWKQGRTIHAKGEIRNISGVPKSNVDVCSIAVGEFTPLGITREMIHDFSGNTVQMKFENNKISIVGTIGSNTFIISGKYTALN